ncbi:MAG: class I SAM-dependent methyltransferase [Chloroflexi bacterium]|nr:class I SAM-dependent methyltransferase [Chloroflexota bacterium]
MSVTLTEEAHRTSLEIQARLEENAPNYSRWIVSQAAPHVGQRLLDVGCSTGNITRHFADRELVVGVDANPYALRLARESWASRPNVELLEMSVPSPELIEVGNRGFDTVTCINVIEHIQDDVEALRQMAHALHPRGRLFLLAPANPWLYGSMDASDHHYRRYTKAGLWSAVEQAGLRPLSIQAMNAVGALGWFVNGRILRRELIPSTQAGLYDRFIPAIARIERVLPPPVGQSLVLVAER